MIQYTKHFFFVEKHSLINPINLMSFSINEFVMSGVGIDRLGLKTRFVKNWSNLRRSGTKSWVRKGLELLTEGIVMGYLK